MLQQMKDRPTNRRKPPVEVFQDDVDVNDTTGGDDDSIVVDDDTDDFVSNPELWPVQEADRILKRMRRLAVKDRQWRIKRQQQQQQQQPPDVSHQCVLNNEYVNKVDVMQNNVFDLAQDIVVDLGGEMIRLKKQHNKTVEMIKQQHLEAMEELRRQHNESLSYFRLRMDRMETIINASQASLLLLVNVF